MIRCLKKEEVNYNKVDLCARSFSRVYIMCNSIICVYDTHLYINGIQVPLEVLDIQKHTSTQCIIRSKSGVYMLDFDSMTISRHDSGSSTMNDSSMTHSYNDIVINDDTIYYKDKSILNDIKYDNEDYTPYTYYYSCILDNEYICIGTNKSYNIYLYDTELQEVYNDTLFVQCDDSGDPLYLRGLDCNDSVVVTVDCYGNITQYFMKEWVCQYKKFVHVEGLSDSEIVLFSSVIDDGVLDSSDGKSSVIDSSKDVSNSKSSTSKDCGSKDSEIDGSKDSEIDGSKDCGSKDCGSKDSGIDSNKNSGIDVSDDSIHAGTVIDSIHAGTVMDGSKDSVIDGSTQCNITTGHTTLDNSTQDNALSQHETPGTVGMHDTGTAPSYEEGDTVGDSNTHMNDLTDILLHTKIDTITTNKLYKDTSTIEGCRERLSYCTDDIINKIKGIQVNKIKGVQEDNGDNIDGISMDNMLDTESVRKMIQDCDLSVTLGALYENIMKLEHKDTLLTDMENDVLFMINRLNIDRNIEHVKTQIDYIDKKIKQKGRMQMPLVFNQGIPDTLIDEKKSVCDMHDNKLSICRVQLERVKYVDDLCKIVVSNKGVSADTKDTNNNNNEGNRHKDEDQGVCLEEDNSTVRVVQQEQSSTRSIVQDITNTVQHSSKDMVDAQHPPNTPSFMKYDGTVYTDSTVNDTHTKQEQYNTGTKQEQHNTHTKQEQHNTGIKQEQYNTDIPSNQMKAMFGNTQFDTRSSTPINGFTAASSNSSDIFAKVISGGSSIPVLKKEDNKQEDSSVPNAFSRFARSSNLYK